MDLWSKLDSLVREANDPWLTVYVMNNLGTGVPPRSPYHSAMLRWQAQLRAQLLEMCWNPRLATMKSLKERLTRPSKGVQPDLRALMTTRRKLAVGAQQIELATKAAAEFANLLRDVARDGPEGVRTKLKDPHPLTRWIAATIAGKKRMHMEPELIRLLMDSSQAVRQAARTALVRLSRGNDFGPPPRATAKQAASSARAWQCWYSQQQPPVPEYLPTPQLAQADDPPAPHYEPLPRPQTAETDEAHP